MEEPVKLTGEEQQQFHWQSARQPGDYGSGTWFGAQPPPDYTLQLERIATALQKIAELWDKDLRNRS